MITSGSSLTAPVVQAMSGKKTSSSLVAVIIYLISNVFFGIPPHQLSKQFQNRGVVTFEVWLPGKVIVPLTNTVGGVVEKIYQPIEI